MAIHVLPDTLTALGGDLLPECKSRSLFKDRFSYPDASDETTPSRKDWFDSLRKRNAVASNRLAWLSPNAERLYARLMSRLLVDLASGVMENANVNLDRYGLPVIPGSAVKGCARRMALQALHDWVAHQQTKGSEEPPATDDACAPCCEGFKTPAHMLAAIACVFGWSPEDWKNTGNSDFAWACVGHAALLKAVKSSLPVFEDFAGTIAFLAASPNDDPGLELDVVTPHHTVYHSPEPERNRDRQRWETWKGHRSAPDIEDPVPVFFPAVRRQAENDYFTFPLIPLRLADRSGLDKPGDLALAKCWLASGLELFGVGAKTSAGYGWFDASDELQQKVKTAQAGAAKAEVERRRRQEEAAEKQRLADAARRSKEREMEVTKDLSEDEKEDWKLAQLTDQQFEVKVRSFFKEPRKGGPSEPEKKAIVRSLRASRLNYWKEFKAKASKGGELARAEQSIRAINKQLNGDKMP